jgi:hypothetical protein
MKMNKRYLTLLQWPIIELGPFDTGPVVTDFDVRQGDYSYTRQVHGDRVTDCLQVMGPGYDGEPDVVFMSVTEYLNGVQVDHYLMLGAPGAEWVPDPEPVLEADIPF